MQEKEIEKVELTPDLIYGLVNSLLARNFDNRAATPEFHMELWELMCSDEPNVAVAAPRGHAKSTAVTHSYAIANICFRTADHIMIVSDTEGQAVNFLNGIKSELSENEDLKELFGIIYPFKKDKESELIVRFRDGHLCRVIVKGSEQRIRGFIWRGKRPNLYICDDLENDEIVMNDERRRKFKQWFMSALMQSGAKGAKFRVVGTILHMDSLLEGMMPPLDDPYTVEEDLKSYSTAKRTWKAIRYKAHNEDFSKILWKEQYTAEHFKRLRENFIEQGYPEGYSQEFLNYPIDETNAYFRKTDIPEIEEDKQPEDYYVGVDLAISQKDTAAYSVFVVAGLTANNILRIRDVRRFRGDALDILDMIFEIQYMYSPEMFFIEQENIARTLGPVLNKEMEARGSFPNIQVQTATQDKQKRARALQARMRQGKVEFDTEADWFSTMQLEFLQFPRGKFMDQVDATAWIALGLDKMYVAPTAKDLLEEEYLNEIEDNEDYMMLGASSITGY